MTQTRGVIGYTCAYTPLPLFHAAGLAPYRVLPIHDCPDQSGHLLHDNLCPHVKRVLDRAMSGDVPAFSGMVFMNSCDSMRRLYDAWNAARSDSKSILVDLPATVSDATILFFRDEIARLKIFLESIIGEAITGSDLIQGIELHNRISALIAALQAARMNASLTGGSSTLQAAYNHASTTAPDEAIVYLKKMLGDSTAPGKDREGVPVYLFGNVLPEPEAFDLFESCGADIVSDDVCTGSRLFAPITGAPGPDPLRVLAESLLSKQPCARTFDSANPGSLGEEIVESARRSNARGVIGYTAKFCDPYIARMPGVREALRKEGIPFLLLEGDCSLRSIGQHRTRIEAFIEMMR
ncbi:MAG: 2-hydroxyacyl-CoA dehydratase [Chrysiogenales bacterium]|nr:MAG: 2-hydroxyacyl-CoA dehydratase [Chrysiogenales bacterium]